MKRELACSLAAQENRADLQEAARQSYWRNSRERLKERCLSMEWMIPKPNNPLLSNVEQVPSMETQFQSPCHASS
jgi:hypothetical protein